MIRHALRTIWLHPSATAKKWLQHEKLGLSMLLIIWGGIVGSFFSFALPDDSLESSNSIAMVAFVIIFIAPIFSLIGWFITGGIYLLFARLLKGVGSYTDTLRVIALSSLPSNAIGTVVAIVGMFVLGDHLFQPAVSYTNTEQWWVTLASTSMFVGYIWSFVALIQSMRVAHQYSVWRALFSVILPSIIITLFVIAAIILLLIPLLLLM